MKTAVNPDGEPLQAGPTAPPHAVCPYCQGSLALRQRQAMDGQVTYFWRHEDNRRLHCLKRSSPAGQAAARGKTNSEG